MIPPLQKEAPDFSGTAVIQDTFTEISLKEFAGKYVVLFFYSIDFGFVCSTEIIAFSDRVDEFLEINCIVIGASCDSEFTHLSWINMARKKGGISGIRIPLLADKSGKIAKDYGIYNEETGTPNRGLFIIDNKQILRQITINDLPVGRSVDETLRLVKAFQHTDTHKELCPINWKLGSIAIKPESPQ